MNSKTLKTRWSDKLAQLKANKFAVNFFNVVKANTLAQVLLILSIPILARFYGPEAFGLLAVFTAILQIAATLGTLKYERLIPNKVSNYAAGACAFAGLISLITTSALLFIASTQAKFLYASIDSLERLGNLLYLLPLTVFFVGVNQLLNGWCVRQDKLQLVNRARIYQAISYICSAFMIYGITQSSRGLVVSTAVSWALMILAYRSIYSSPWQFALKSNYSRLLRFFRKTFVQACVMTLVAFVNVLSYLAPILIVSALFSSNDLGQYSLVMRLVGAPLAIITGAMALSFWAHSAKLARERNYAELRTSYLRTTKVLLIPAFLVVIGCLIGSQFITTVLGGEWDKTGVILIYLIPMFLGIALVSPTNHLIVLNKEKLQLLSDGLRLGLMVAIYFLSKQLSIGLSMTVLLLSIASMVGHFGLFITQLLVHRNLTKERQN